MRPALVSVRLASAGPRAQSPVMRGIPALIGMQNQQQVGRLLTGIATRGFSVYAPLRNKQIEKQHAQPQQGGNPDMPSFSFDGLGASKGIKNAIIVILGVLGTIETWVWCKWIWTWWKGETEEKQGQAAR